MLDIVLTFPVAGDVSVIPPLSTSDHSMVHFEVPTNFHSIVSLPMPNLMDVDYNLPDRYFSTVDWLGLFEAYYSTSDVYRRFCSVVYGAFATFRSKL